MDLTLSTATGFAGKKSQRRFSDFAADGPHIGRGAAVDDLAALLLKPSIDVSEMQSGCGGLGRCRGANPYLAPVPEIDWRSKDHLVARFDAVADLDLGPEVAHFGDLAAVHDAVLDR